MFGLALSEFSSLMPNFSIHKKVSTSIWILNSRLTKRRTLSTAFWQLSTPSAVAYLGPTLHRYVQVFGRIGSMPMWAGPRHGSTRPKSSGPSRNIFVCSGKCAVQNGSSDCPQTLLQQTTARKAAWRSSEWPRMASLPTFARIFISCGSRCLNFMAALAHGSWKCIYK